MRGCEGVRLCKPPKEKQADVLLTNGTGGKLGPFEMPVAMAKLRRGDGCSAGRQQLNVGKMVG